MPINITWHYNSSPKLPLGVSTLSIGGKSSVLTIESVTWLHGGDYECIASNRAGNCRYVAEFLVKGMECALFSQHLWNEAEVLFYHLTNTKKCVAFDFICLNYQFYPMWCFSLFFNLICGHRFTSSFNSTWSISLLIWL